MNIVIGSDHGGLELKAVITAHLEGQGHTVSDLGTHGTDSVDYPDYGRLVANAVVSGEAERGVLVCGTGQGMAMSANKIPGVRAAVVMDPFSARMATEHNDARILCLGQRVLGTELAKVLVDAWMSVEFEGGRHARRVEKIEGN